MPFRAIQAFGEHAVGDLIEDIEGEQLRFVVRVVDEPEPERPEPETHPESEDGAPK